MAAQDTSRPGSASDERRVTAWIGQGVVIEGSIEVGNHALILGANASVKADLIARSILISGAVIGNVMATERLDLQATGSVEGDISAPRVVVADGAIIKGKVDTG